MNIGLYQSASSLTALERWQDAVSQNITSGQVTGFKKRTVEFSGMPMGQMTIGTGANAESQPALMPKATYGINFQSGEMTPTGRNTDVALQGEGFFKVQNPDSSVSYTRAGELHIRPDRTVVTKEGFPILSDSGSPMSLQADGGDLSIGEDGTVKQGTNQVGKIGVFRFADNASLIPVGGGLFAAASSSPAIPVDKPAVLQGYLEGSNVAPLREMVSLIQISRAYEANQKIITSTDDTLAKTLEALG